MNLKEVDGFSKFTKRERLQWLKGAYSSKQDNDENILKSFWHSNKIIQNKLDEFSENTISNFSLPYGIAPNFLINGKIYCVPMVIEESSVVAAASRSAKFWMKRGGFKAQVVDTKKIGQLHFYYDGDKDILEKKFDAIKEHLKNSVSIFELRMRERGGGLQDILLIDLSDKEQHLYQLRCEFETCEAMGANYINTILEYFSKFFSELMGEVGEKIKVLMAIVSNYTPDCLVRSSVSCPLDQLIDSNDQKYLAQEFVERFSNAVRISKVDPYRAVTHNKGIMNGIDAVVLATGNDFRAIEACCHAYAASKGQYQGLTDVSLEDNIFKFGIEIPIAIGTIGGITSLHPLAEKSLKLLGNPNSRELMMIIASVGLAQNFAAIKSLVTSGIQKGHMKMHLLNILNQLGASKLEREETKKHFSDNYISYSGVESFINTMRLKQ